MTMTRSGSRLAQVGLAAASLAAGALLGSAGCKICDCGPTPELVPLDSGTYEIVETQYFYTPTDQDQSRPELIGGIVEVDQERVELSFTDVDGQDWVVDYVVLP